MDTIIDSICSLPGFINIVLMAAGIKTVCRVAHCFSINYYVSDVTCIYGTAMAVRFRNLKMED